MIQEEKTILLHKNFSSAKNLRKNAVDAIVEAIKESTLTVNLSPEELYLAIDEAVTNAMEHGNRWNPDKQIHVLVAVKGSSIWVHIADDGAGFNCKKIRTTLSKSQILGERGRGIYILFQLCKPSWNKTGNEITLELKLKNPQ